MTADSAPATAREELREQIAVAVADECALSIPNERGFAFAAADRILALLSPPSETREIERLREAAREIQQEADAHFRRGQPWVPGTDWLFEVISRALTATPEDRNGE